MPVETRPGLTPRQRRRLGIDSQRSENTFTLLSDIESDDTTAENEGE